VVDFTLWLFNIAMENGPFIDGLPFLKMVDLSISQTVSHNQVGSSRFYPHTFPALNSIPALVARPFHNRALHVALPTLRPCGLWPQHLAKEAHSEDGTLLWRSSPSKSGGFTW